MLIGLFLCQSKAMAVRNSALNFLRIDCGYWICFQVCPESWAYMSFLVFWQFASLVALASLDPRLRGKCSNAPVALCFLEYRKLSLLYPSLQDWLILLENRLWKGEVLAHSVLHCRPLKHAQTLIMYILDSTVRMFPQDLLVSEVQARGYTVWA